MTTTSIDDFLSGIAGNSQQPATPESHDQEPEPIEEVESNEPDYGVDGDEPSEPQSDDSPPEEPDSAESEQESRPKEPETDEYGNTQEPENEAIRERLARQARKHQAEMDDLRALLSQKGASQEVQQAAKDFEYDPEAKGDWQQQLASFVKQTVNSMTREQEETKTRQQEHEAQRAFETKFHQGMSKFDDFKDVMTNLDFQITDPMTIATRAMENPASFLYAAAKRNPQELERISKLRDPYVQMTEMGKLEERMRRNKPTTKAPRPLGRTQDDSITKAKPKEKDNSGDDLLASADAKRMSTVKTRLKANR